MPTVSDEFDYATLDDCKAVWSTLVQHGTSIDAFSSILLTEARLDCSIDPAVICPTGVTFAPSCAGSSPAIDSAAAYRTRVFSGLTVGIPIRMEVAIRHRGWRVATDGIACPGYVPFDPSFEPSFHIPSLVITNDVVTLCLDGDIGPQFIDVGGDFTRPDQVLITPPILPRGDGTLDVSLGWYNLRAITASYWDIAYVRLVEQLVTKHNYVYTI